MDEYSIETMVVDDIDGVLEVESLSFSTPWSKKAFELELTNNKHALYRVVKVDNKIIAYGGVWLLFDEGHITNIAVHPNYRGCGYGKVLLQDMMKCAKYAGMKSMTLEVRVTNDAAINLYKNHGFVTVAKRKGYYEDTGEDALIMWRYEL